MTIRELGLADGEGWATLRCALWPHHKLAELRDELPGMLEGEFAGIGAFDGETLLAFAEVSVRPHGDGCDTSPVPWLEAIYVLPAFRRRGVAGRLVAAVEAWARSRGFSELGSDADLYNLTSRLSHARWGFEETKRVVMFRKALA